MSRNSRGGSGFKASQKTGQRLKVPSDKLGEAGSSHIMAHAFLRFYILSSKREFLRVIWALKITKEVSFKPLTIKLSVKCI